MPCSPSAWVNALQLFQFSLKVPRWANQQLLMDRRCECQCKCSSVTICQPSEEVMTTIAATGRDGETWFLPPFLNPLYENLLRSVSWQKHKMAAFWNFDRNKTTMKWQLSFLQLSRRHEMLTYIYLHNYLWSKITLWYEVSYLAAGLTRNWRDNGCERQTATEHEANWFLPRYYLLNTNPDCTPVKPPSNQALALSCWPLEYKV